MVIRKILASSTYAIIGTLQAVKNRLVKMLADEENQQLTLKELLDEDEFELLVADEEEVDNAQKCDKVSDN